MNAVYDTYLLHDWMFWPLALLAVPRMIFNWLYSALAWLPRELHRLAQQELEKLLEIVSASSAVLMALSGIDTIPQSWHFLAGVVGVVQFWSLIQGGRDTRFVAMITATVFWWAYMIALVPRRMTDDHVFLVPLCIAYIVNTFSLLHDAPKA